MSERYVNGQLVGYSDRFMREQEDREAMPDTIERFDTYEQKIGFKIARCAHWLVNDSGYTKAMAARELREIAREMLPRELYEQSIGDAGKL